MKFEKRSIIYQIITIGYIANSVFGQHLKKPTKKRPYQDTAPPHNDEHGTDDIIIPWSDLSQTLSVGSYSKNDDNNSSNNTRPIMMVKRTEWLDQCMKPFRSPFQFISNWNLMEESSGLCMNTASCAYENCTGPIQDVITKDDNPIIYRYNSSIITDDMLLNDQRLNLPEIVLHPKHVGDISEAIKFATTHKIGISVKTSGHSYTGSSTKKGTILLNLRKLKSYSGDVTNGSLIECQFQQTNKFVFERGAGGQDATATATVAATAAATAFDESCKLAIARNKPAVLRVGGGEVWNDVMDAVNVQWNCGSDTVNSLTDCPNPKDRKYHIVSGAAATVSAAGGWLASGGLSGNNGMRMYGLGVDQVLHVEMVLPDGRHIRFGPSEWDDVPGFLYPQTTEVTGYCNTGDLSLDDESMWVWEKCEDDVDFKALWYAVRGGGGGAYGVITSIYYQLHDYPDQIHGVSFLPSDYIENLPEGNEKKQLKQKLDMYTSKFFFYFFFMPHKIGVTNYASNSCGSPDQQGLLSRNFICFNGADEVIIAAWKRFVGKANDNLYKVENTGTESFVHSMIVFAPLSNPATPKGKGLDAPFPVTHSYLPSFGGHMNVPLSIFQSEESVDKLIQIIQSCCVDKLTYILGGNIPYSGDGMNALPIHRRHGFLIGRPDDDETYHQLLDLFYHAEDGKPVSGDNFPGFLCHNHASFFMATPQRKDWTKLCDVAWDDEERHEKCFTWQEATLGVENVKKLEKIHAMVDPNHLFDCADCVGYDDGSDDMYGKKKSKKQDKKMKKKILKGKKKTMGYDNYPLYCLSGDVSLIGNGICNESMNNPQCHYDGGDCD